MYYRSTIKMSIGLTLLALIALGSAGCYTMLRHPQVADEELVGQHESEMTGTTCTDCHNNEYDHHRSSSHYWGFGSWGIRTYPYGYYGYTGWQRYYYDPWWWGYGYGYGYYDPWPYYNPGGGYGPGSGSGSSPSPDRPSSRRGLQQAPMGQPPPNPPPPAYISPAPSSPNQGGSSGQSQQGDNDNNKREGRRGGGK